jgi:cell division protein FtsX
VRSARQMRKTLWPHFWMSFASIIILAAALAILSYRMGAQSCR